MKDAVKITKTDKTYLLRPKSDTPQKKRVFTIPKEITQKLREGNHAAFEEVYKYCHEGVYRFLMTLTRDTKLSEDIMQEAFMYLWDKRQQIDPEKNILNYLFHIVRSLFISHLRRITVSNKHRQSLDPDGPQLYAADASMIAEETELLINIVVAQMPGKRQAIFQLSYYEGLSNKEIAERLGIDLRNVRTQLHYATKEIKQFLNTFLVFFII